MKFIHLKNCGKRATVDDDDFPFLSENRWRLQHDGYVVRTERVGGAKKTIYMQRVILNVEPGTWVDHKDHKKRNNRKRNLRPATKSQNGANKLKANGTSSTFKGVRPHRLAFVARIKKDQVERHLGSFATERDAALAYNLAAVELFGEFAKLNNLRVHS